MQLKSYRRVSSRNRRNRPVGAIFTSVNRQFAKTLRRVALERGRGTEAAVDSALEKMREHGEIDAFWSSPRLDKTGTDRIIRVGKIKIPIQIKSSCAGARRHQEKFQKSGRDDYVHLVVVEPSAKAEEIIPEIKKAIQRHCSFDLLNP